MACAAQVTLSGACAAECSLRALSKALTVQAALAGACGAQCCGAGLGHPGTFHQPAAAAGVISNLLRVADMLSDQLAA